MTQEGFRGAADKREQEPQHHHHGDVEETDAEILAVDEMIGEHAPGQVAQVEHVGGPIDGDDYGEHAHRGYHHTVEQVVQPRLRDGAVVHVVAFAVGVHPLAHTRDGQYAGQLHDPPYQQLNAQQGVAQPTAHHRGDEHHQRDIGVEHVAPRDVLVMTPYHAPLPQGTYQQDGGED